MQQLIRYVIGVLCLLFICVLHANAQQRGTLTGRITDAENHEALVRASVQLYTVARGDTTLVTASYTDAQGAFALNGVGQGSYRLKASY